MSWEDRLQGAAYTAPSGVRITFDYEAVEVRVPKKGTAFESTDVNGTYVQDLGRAGRRLPIRAYIHGENYDLTAAAFLSALSETGQGTLEHPTYGTIPVVPLGDVVQKDNTVQAGGVAVFEVTFFETTGALYPAASGSPLGALEGSLDDFGGAMAEEFAESVQLDSASDRATFTERYSQALNGARSGLDPLTKATREVETEFNAIADSIDRSLDILVGDPLTLATQTIALLEAPAKAAARIQDRLAGYGDVIADLIGRDATTPNELYTGSLYASAAVAGAVASTTAAAFPSRPAALEAAEVVAAQFDEVVAWREAGYEATGEVDTGGSYMALQEAVAVMLGFIIEISFTLPAERREVLTRPRALIDYVAEKYGTVDEDLDFFIESNNLTGDEIIELPAGRELVFYI
jgi:prophage DNA circulation protein